MPRLPLWRDGLQRRDRRRRRDLPCDWRRRIVRQRRVLVDSEQDLQWYELPGCLLVPRCQVRLLRADQSSHPLFGLPVLSVAAGRPRRTERSVAQRSVCSVRLSAVKDMVVRKWARDRQARSVRRQRPRALRIFLQTSRIVRLGFGERASITAFARHAPPARGIPARAGLARRQDRVHGRR